MVVDIIKSKRFIGLPISSVREQLGPSTGDYYYYDVNYTYSLTNKKSENWILTFVSDGSGHVKNVFIRKSCCSISRKIGNASLNLLGLLVIEPILETEKGVKFISYILDFIFQIKEHS